MVYSNKRISCSIFEVLYYTLECRHGVKLGQAHHSVGYNYSVQQQKYICRSI